MKNKKKKKKTDLPLNLISLVINERDKVKRRMRVSKRKDPF